MPKWEYCEVGPISTRREGKLTASNSSVVALNPNELHYRPIREDDRDNIGKIIAGLGNAGWEMVGAGNVGGDCHVLYFKRLVE